MSQYPDERGRATRPRTGRLAAAIVMGGIVVLLTIAVVSLN
jgi:hypothetical protein